MIKNYRKIRDFSNKTSAKRALYSQILVIPCANFIVAMIKNTSITPNAATTISLIFGILMGVSIAFVPGYTGIFAGVVFYNLRLMWDIVDGTLARWKNLSSDKGSWWDQLVGKISTLILLGSLIYRIYPKSLYFGLIVFLLFVYSSHRLITGTKKKYPTKKLLEKHNSSIANIYFEISRYHIYTVPLLLINKPLWVIYGFGIIELIWIIKTIICILDDLRN